MTIYAYYGQKTGETRGEAHVRANILKDHVKADEMYIDTEEMGVTSFIEETGKSNLKDIIHNILPEDTLALTSLKDLHYLNRIANEALLMLRAKGCRMEIHDIDNNTGYQVLFATQ